MGKRGPAKLPQVIRLARGERRPSQINYDEPKLDPPRSLEPPKELKGEGRQEWLAHIKHLTERGVLTGPDLKAFEDYCRTLTRLRRYERKADKAGPELAIAKGYEGAAIKLRAQVNALRQQCGLTPSSRGQVRAAKKAMPAASPTAGYLSVIPGGHDSRA